MKNKQACYNLSQSEDDKLHIEYSQREKYRYYYDCKDGVATFTEKTAPFNIDHLIKFYFGGKPATKIYVPASMNQELNIKLSSGTLDMKTANITVKEVTIRASSGDINLSNLTVEGVANIKVTSGDIQIADSVFETALNIKSSTSDTKTTKVRANAINLDSSSGDWSIGLIGDKSEYSVDAEISSGNITIEGQGAAITTREDLKWGEGKKKIKSSTSCGDFSVIFEE